MTAGPYRTPQPPLQPTARQELEKNLERIAAERDRLAETIALVDEFLAKQQSTIAGLCHAQTKLPPTMHRHVGALGAVVASTAAHLAEAESARSSLWGQWYGLDAEANRIKERLGS